VQTPPVAKLIKLTTMGREPDVLIIARSVLGHTSIDN
jgi:hypothetical protein